MYSILRAVRYLWVVVVMRATWILPDWTPIMQMRGMMIRPVLGGCGRNFQVCSGVTIVGDMKKLVVGDNVYLAHGCWLHLGTNITLGDEVMCGPYTVVVTGNHGIMDGSYRYGSGGRSPVRIGRGTWLGARVTVLPGVSIGQGTLCAAGSVVTKDIPDYVVAGGVPARVLERVDPKTGQRSVVVSKR